MVPPVNISDSCFNALHRIVSALGTSDVDLVARYWNSWGRPPVALNVHGHWITQPSRSVSTYYLGYYDQCVGLKETVLGEMNYCLYPMLMKIPGGSTPDLTAQITMGICYPSVCTAEEFAMVLSQGIPTSNGYVDGNCDVVAGATMILYDKDSDRSISCPVVVNIDVGTKLTVIVCIILVGLVIVGSSLDCALGIHSDQDDRYHCHGNKTQFEDQNSNSIDNIQLATLDDTQDDCSVPTRILLSFSLIKNASNLFTVNSKTSNTIKAISGIRVISMFWIIANHTWQAINAYSELVENKVVFSSKVKEFNFQPIINVTFSVETFLLLGGLLVAYTMFKDLETHGKFRIFYFYVHRFFRIAPLYYLFIFLAIKVLPKMGSGPIYKWRLLSYETCQHYWWTNIFFINNFIPVLSCLGHTWYMAIDMQFFIISPIFIILLHNRRSLAVFLITAVIVGSVVVVGAIAFINKHNINLFADSDIVSNIKYLYCKPYFRINAYLIGIILGYILHKKYSIAHLPISASLQNLIYGLLWVLSVLLCLPVVYGTYKIWHNQPFSEFESVSYHMFSRTAWCIGVAILIFICNRCNDRFLQRTVNGILSWDGWNPLVKLTFGAYLIHYVMLDFMMGTMQSSIIYTDYFYINLFITTTVLSYCIAVLLVLFVEFTTINVVVVIFTVVGIQPRHKLYYHK